MKKIFLLTSVLSISIPVNAEYLIKYKIETQPNSIIMVDWESTDSSYTSWQSIGEPYNCSTWTPDESTIPVGQSFIQERTCSINQERLRQERELSSKGSYKNIGVPQLETRIEDVLQSRNSNGLLESWVSIGSLYGEWTNSGALYDCTNWTPNPNTVNNGVSFTQNATDCKQDQTRTRQDREQETTTLVIRNVGSEIVENQTLPNQANSRNSVGTKLNTVCYYDISSQYKHYFEYVGGYGFYVNGVAGIPDIFHNPAFAPNPLIVTINSTHFTYNDGSKIWHITRGLFMNDGYNSYEICIE